VDSTLSTVRRLYAQGRYQAALKEIGGTPGAQDVEPEVRLLKAQILLELGQFTEDEDELHQLTQAEPQIAGAAHYLLARIYLTTDSAKSEQHKQLAESILPNTAEAFYLCGMTAASADEALTWLSKARELDPSHYGACKARAFAYYSVKAYQKMAEDVSALIAMRPKDYMGYALGAIAHRETGQFELALKEHAQAIELCTLQDELNRLYDERRRTYMRSGNQKAALQDAEQRLAFRADQPSSRVPVFAALLALGQYEKAQAEYTRVAKLGLVPGRSFRLWMEGYASELLDTGQPFDFPPDIAARAPFYLMQQASQLYSRLREKARPLPLGGQWLLGDWSPDGHTVAYCRFSAFSWLPGTMEGIELDFMSQHIEIMDLVTGKTRQLTRFGALPVWSPDGQHIAFTDYKEGKPDLWLVSLAGGEPRKLTPGYHANWSRDSQHVFFRSITNGTICSINIDGPNAKPVSALEFPGRFMECFSISPGGDLIAIEKSSVIHVLTFPEGIEVAQWETPWPLLNMPNQLQWHPNGKTVILNSRSYYNQMGMCLFNVEQAKATHVLNVTRPWCRTLWSPDGSQLLIDPFTGKDVWLMDIDPNLPLAESLAPALTTEDFLRQRLETWDQRIEADPLYADNYMSRAVVHLAAKDFDRASQDMDHCNTLINDPNDPAVYAINHWADMYKKTGGTTEAQLFASLKTQLAERYPE